MLIPWPSELTASLTFANNAALLRHLHDLAALYFASLFLVPGFEGSWVLQPMPRSITSKSAASGGNPLGLDGSEDLVCTLLPPLPSFFLAPIES